MHYSISMIRSILYLKILLLMFINGYAQGNPYGYNDLDEAYLTEMKAENARLTKRIQSQPEPFQKMNTEATYAIRNKDYALALQIALRMETAYPKNADVKNFKGKIQSKNGDASGAVQSFGDAVRLEPKNNWFYINKATAEAERGDIQTALKTINTLVAQSPDWSIGYNFKAALLHSMNKDAEALTAYNDAVKVKPESAQIFTNRGDLYLKSGQKDKAVQDYKAALAIQPDYERAQANLNEIAQSTVSKKDR